MAEQTDRNTFQRGTQAEFRFGFTRKGGAPIVPIDPLRFPSFQIENPAGIQVQTGVAQPFGDPGCYQVLWTIPEDAMLSDDQSHWIIKGLLVDTKKKQFEFKHPFRVTEQRKPTQESRDVVLMGIENTPFRATWTGDFVPASISVSCFLSNAPDAPDTSPIPIAVVPSGPIVSNGDIVYYIDLPPTALKAGMYTILWNVQTSATASTDIDYQQLRVITRSVLQFIPQVKFITGRFQAAFDLPNFISDADYVEGLNHGLDFINQWHPISWYTISDMLRSGPNGTPLQNFWIMASAWWVLHSQSMVELGLAFNLSGASTSLDYDRTSGIDAAMGRLREEMTQNLTPAKTAFKYRSQGIGSLSVRPNQLRSYQSRVWRIESGPGNGPNGPTSQLMQMLNVLGISP
jgi:hypothetical protein